MKLFLVSGFLGSGKTTAIREACQQMMQEERKPAVIANDQGESLVDTAWLKLPGVHALEVTKGCFCCRFNELEERIILLKEWDPEILFAETVGSCVDLVATVVKPLEKQFPDMEIVLSVFADASMLWPLINGETFFLSEEVRYIYHKQLEEADILVLNKGDLLSNDQREKLMTFLRQQYPDKIILAQDSTNRDSVHIWTSVGGRFRKPAHRASLEIDYDRYATGERVLGWLDEKIILRSHDGTALKAAHEFMRDLHRRVHKAGLPIGHLKFLVDDGSEVMKYSYTTISGSGPFPLSDPKSSDHVELLVNARIQADPKLLDDLVKASLGVLANQHQVQISIVSSEAFQPGYPKPVHRL